MTEMLDLNQVVNKNARTVKSNINLYAGLPSDGCKII